MYEVNPLSIIIEKVKYFKRCVKMINIFLIQLYYIPKGDFKT